MMLIRSWKSAEHLAGYQQQDAHEYMQFILNSLHSANGGSEASPREDSQNAAASADSSDAPTCPCIIHKTFYGRLQSTVTCGKCRNTTTALDPFMDLSLDLRQHGGKKRKLNGEHSKDKEKNLPSAAPAAEDGESPPDTHNHMQLAECLRRFTGEERLPPADYSCAKCGGPSEAVKQLSLRRLPPVLSIHLKVRPSHPFAPPLLSSHRPSRADS